MPMAVTSRTISAPVGIRNGRLPMSNRQQDLSVVTDLFDRIKVSNGGTAEIGGLWAAERNALIAEVTAQIVAFQTTNARPVVDGVVDPSGGTLKLMNQYAAEPSPAQLSASVAPAPDGLAEDVSTQVYVTDVSSMSGFGPLRKAVVQAQYTRYLVRVEGSSINWFGIAIPWSFTGQTSTVPHINFTPTPIQGGYSDATYESFGGWGKLWDDYTDIIGGQMAASGADQVLVIPFYRTGQQRNLGDFLGNWRSVISAVLTAAINHYDPTALRDTFQFDSIVSSSFSNGWVAHHQFNTQAAGAAAMTDVLFDLDGVAGGSNWRPDNGVIYLNRAPVARVNPVGKHWYVGGRWGREFTALYGGNLNTHACCRNHLLYHGLWQYCTP
jgi:hypothetical protein